MSVRQSHNRSTNHRHTTRNQMRHPGMKQQLDNVMESVRDLGTETKHAAQAGVQQARDQVDGYVRQGKKRAKAMERSFEDRIRAEPMKALLLASGVGFLCGLLFRRS